MRYPECVEYLYRLGGTEPVAKCGLDNIRTILQRLGNPQARYPSILIAGTNGKGSVAAFLHCILVSSGFHSGLYTSPHLINVEERIALDRQAATPEAFAECVSRIIDVIETLKFPRHPTFFETVTSAAFLYFAEAKVDLAVVEAGMGGRTDSTNILDPLLSIITSVSIDHQQFLGGGLEEIGYQKAGIIHRHGTVISARQRPEVQAILEQEAARQDAVLSYADETAAAVRDSVGGRYRFAFEGMEFEPGLCGRHQVGNAVLAISAALLLKEKGYSSIRAQTLVEGVNRAFNPGRLQKICDTPAIYVDGAHNDEALVKVAEFVEEHTGRPRCLVFAVMSDKQLSSSIHRLEDCFDRIYLTSPSSKRTAAPEQLLTYFPKGIWIEKPIEALNTARQEADTVVVTGSFYLVGEILRSLL